MLDWSPGSYLFGLIVTKGSHAPASTTVVVDVSSGSMASNSSAYISTVLPGKLSPSDRLAVMGYVRGTGGNVTAVWRLESGSVMAARGLTTVRPTRLKLWDSDADHA